MMIPLTADFMLMAVVGVSRIDAKLTPLTATQPADDAPRLTMHFGHGALIGTRILVDAMNTRVRRWRFQTGLCCLQKARMSLSHLFAGFPSSSSGK